MHAEWKQAEGREPRRIRSTRLIPNMRWTRARSRDPASTYSPENRQSARPVLGRAQAGRPHKENGALSGPVSRANDCFAESALVQRSGRIGGARQMRIDLHPSPCRVTEDRRLWCKRQDLARYDVGRAAEGRAWAS